MSLRPLTTIAWRRFCYTWPWIAMDTLALIRSERYGDKSVCVLRSMVRAQRVLENTWLLFSARSKMMQSFVRLCDVKVTYESMM